MTAWRACQRSTGSSWATGILCPRRATSARMAASFPPASLVPATPTLPRAGTSAFLASDPLTDPARSTRRASSVRAETSKTGQPEQGSLSPSHFVALTPDQAIPRRFCPFFPQGSLEAECPPPDRRKSSAARNFPPLRPVSTTPVPENRHAFRLQHFPARATTLAPDMNKRRSALKVSRSAAFGDCLARHLRLVRPPCLRRPVPRRPGLSAAPRKSACPGVRHCRSIDRDPLSMLDWMIRSARQASRRRPETPEKVRYDHVRPIIRAYPVA